ncbi:DnaJ-domain-containing protein [Trametes versicolor FP-101664 SS1]|uniref:DnaJ-domain-containing protein n=1 Tax=Trametes versicolor (strain FP-101664) TaxID=717944 RepID=UPI0004622700|nr:DnaJ-domain-containing protein [Trametes versicolor FP-101664 SS1]EIW56458.1 DnaJ-domain-containing protein [Trametes versicolor FP-101664 SS1]
MANKKSKQAKKKQADQAAAANGDHNGAAEVHETEQENQTGAKDEPIEISSDTPEEEKQVEEVVEEVDPAVQAERVKEQGNAAFKGGRFQEAIGHYGNAIELRPTEPTYWTNRAAAYMALKKFKPALTDCQQAATLQSASPSPKTLVRLARCQLSTGSTAPALSTLRTVLALDAKNDAALKLQQKVLELEAHLRNLESARERREWGMARLALDKCMQVIEGEGGDIPIQWRIWKIEHEIARKNWDAASIAANEALRFEPNSPDAIAVRGLLLWLTVKTAQATQHVQSALRLDPGHEAAMRLRKRIKDVERLKEEGNTAFKSGKLQEAADKYGAALERIGADEREGSGGHIRAMLLSNRATTLVKLDRYEDALADTEESLVLNANSFKALRTRARIHLHLEKYDSAIADFKAAIEQAGLEGSDADVRALRGEQRKAEVALKQSKSKDYYKILGVERSCTEVEIKKAYRRESLKHHPDKGGDEEKFKLVSEAHSILSDPTKRQRYDLGEDDDDAGFGGGGMGGGVDLSDLFAQFHGAGFGGGHGGFGGAGRGPGFSSFGGGGGGGYGGSGYSGYSRGDYSF